ncbi:MAG: TRAP transporter small permease subunit [Gammaproteobacteria bacterium]|nr:TRAP transporter small permease subunit [Pseudomonadota bacterium]MCH9663941.1 TRAP transporter small permease subunit [Gammaproteobacteria bacterium]
MLQPIWTKWHSKMGRALGWLLLLMACLIVLNIAARYVWNRYTIVSYELTLYIHIWVIFLSLSYALQEKAHIGIDIVRTHLRARTQTWIDLLLTALLALPPIVVIAWLGGEYAWTSWKILENSPETGGLDFVYLSKTAIPIGGALLFIQALVIIANCIKSLRHPDTNNNTEGDYGC